MPTLDFKGKQHVYAHHLSVPYRPLVPHPDKSVGATAGDAPAADDNLIIHGDNLDALKALLPRYTGSVKCIYIDPPYNTGNEGWVYNDNVNSPLMQGWLRDNSPVDNEDLERHDKWLCMMWPRLHLLRELLSEDGVVFVSIDENEQHHLRMLMNEVFGEENFLNCFAWVSNLKGRQISKSGAARTYEYVLNYAKNRQEAGDRGTIDTVTATKLMPDAYQMRQYKVLEDEFGPYVIKNELHNTNSRFNEETRPNLVFNIHYSPDPLEVRFSDVDDPETYDGFARISPHACNDGVHRFHAWRWGKDKIRSELLDLHIEQTQERTRIYTKVRDFQNTSFKDLITNISGSNRLLKDMGIEFPNPKPVDLIKILIQVSAPPGTIVLDSFAGSGSTAHAVLAINAEDCGNRKFILVECEDYADTMTAERVRRAIDGVPTAKSEIVRGGLGGSFTYCTLGSPIEIEGMLTCEALPAFRSLAAYLLHTASGIAAGERALDAQNEDGLFYSDDTTNYYLLYERDVEYLRGHAAVLNEVRARRISAACRAADRKAIVFAAGKYIGQRELADWGITFVQLPYQMHRKE